MNPAASSPAETITADRLLLALVLGVATRRERQKRKDRAGSLLDECLDLLAEPALSPNVVRLRSGGPDPRDAERRRIIAEAHAIMGQVAPVARALAEARA